MLDGNDSDNEFDNLLTRVGAKEFFENILGGIERQEINSSDTSSSESSSESESDSDSISPLYGDSSDSESESDAASSSSYEKESPLFDVVDEKEDDVEEETSPLLETDIESKNEPGKKNVADVLKIIENMSKLM